MESLTNMSAQYYVSSVEYKQTKRYESSFPKQLQSIDLSHGFTNCQYTQIWNTYGPKADFSPHSGSAIRELPAVKKNFK